jgi:DNA-binding response OmpR family regulator
VTVRAETGAERSPGAAVDDLRVVEDPQRVDAEATTAEPNRALVVAADPMLADALADDLNAVGYVARIVPDGASADELGPASVVVVAPEGDGAERQLAHALRRSPSFAGTPIVWVARPETSELSRSDAIFDDFLELPYTRAGLSARLSVARRRFGHAGGDVLRRGSLVLNLSTFQASVGGEPIELTYMEYQLLRFLASTPSRVHTRQAILHHVWGYDYYGGVRTVDVHVRRLRVKLGEHASMIETVRSVGYRFAGGM